MGNGTNLTDDELREIAELIKKELPPVYAFANGNRKRAIMNWTAVGGVAVVLGMVQAYLLRPIESKVDHTDSVLAMVQASVQKHHEESAFLYVTRSQYDRDIENILREVRGLRDLMIVMEQREDKK